MWVFSVQVKKVLGNDAWLELFWKMLISSKIRISAQRNSSSHSLDIKTPPEQVLRPPNMSKTPARGGIWRMSIAIDSLKHVPFSNQKCPRRCVSYPSPKATPIKTSWAVKNNNTVHPPETTKSRKNWNVWIPCIIKGRFWRFVQWTSRMYGLISKLSISNGQLAHPL